jgi:hypothetical protein
MQAVRSYFGPFDEEYRFNKLIVNDLNYIKILFIP